MSTYTIKDLVTKWKEIGKEAKKEECFLSIYQTHKDNEYEVLVVSWYVKSFDDSKKLIRTPTRVFNDKAAKFCRATRDIGYGRVITDRGKPTIVIEPGKDILDFWASVESVSLSDLKNTVRLSTRGKNIRKLDRIKLAREKRKVADAKVEAIKNKSKTTAKEQRIQREFQESIEEAAQERMKAELDAEEKLAWQIACIQNKYEERINELEQNNSCMVNNLIHANEENKKLGGAPPTTPPSVQSLLGKAQGSVNPKPLPGSACTRS